MAFFNASPMARTGISLMLLVYFTPIYIGGRDLRDLHLHYGKSHALIGPVAVVAQIYTSGASARLDDHGALLPGTTGIQKEIKTGSTVEQ
ncbi:hypothetical protein BD414DRAFT_492420 [Trametes punicea]|nr:hypothetical protein BD414DRAFT_492420 [Trametes punicea]